MKFIIDPEIKKYIRRLHKQEFELLEKSILEEGCRDPLIIWANSPDGNVLIDGHHRKEICEKHEIEDTLKFIQKEFPSKDDVKEWVILNQLSRRNLTDINYKYYIGNLYNIRKQKHGGQLPNEEEKGIDHFGLSLETAQIIADEFKIGKTSVKRHAQLATAIDSIADNCGEDVKQKILDKELDLTQKNIMEIGQMEPERQKKVIHNVETGKMKSVIQEEFKAKPHISQSNADEEWFTPEKYINAVREVMGDIDLDPASTQEANKVVKAKQIYTIEDDGLRQDWKGRVWLNPPYSTSKIPLFCDKIKKHYDSGEVTEAVVVVNNATETEWFNILISSAKACVFPKGRIKFYKPKGIKIGSAPLQGQVFVYFGENWKRFLEVFKSFGWGAELG